MNYVSQWHLELEKFQPEGLGHYSFFPTARLQLPGSLEDKRLVAGTGEINMTNFRTRDNSQRTKDTQLCIRDTDKLMNIGSRNPVVAADF